MIELIDVGKYYVTEFGKHYVFRNVSLLLPPDRSVGVIGPNGAGKSTFLRLVGGADIPSEGTILRSGRISPPMGLTPGLQNALTAAENARFAGRIYGLDRDEITDMIEYVRETADIGKFFDQPVYMYSAGMKQRVAFAINMSMTFDYYLFDEISAAGDKEFRKMAREMVFERLRTSKFVMTSHSTRDLLEFCESGIVIRDGELTYFEDIHEAVAFYGDSDEGDDESIVKKMERRKARGERRRLKDTGAESPKLLSAGESTTEVGAMPEEGAEERKKRRAERLRRRNGEATDTPAPADTLEADTPLPAANGGAEPVGVLRLEAPAASEAPDTSVAAAKDTAGADERSARAADTREMRRQRRMERQSLVAEQKEDSTGGVATEALEIAEAAPAAHAAGETGTQAETNAADADSMDRMAQRAAAEERRRLRRENRERLAAGSVEQREGSAPTETEDVASVGLAAETQAETKAAEDENPGEITDTDRAARRAAVGEHRRQRREKRRSLAAKSVEESDDSTPVETLRIESIETDAGSLAAISDTTDEGYAVTADGDSAARRAAGEAGRRHRRRDRARDADAVEPDESNVIPLEQPGEATYDNARAARRTPGERRRRRGNARDAETVETAQSAVTATEFEEGKKPVAGGEVSNALEHISAAGRHFVAESEVAQQDSSAAFAVASGSVRPVSSSQLPDADRRLLLLRLAMRQDRAQAKASRAARLLLQHLEAPDNESPSSRHGRAMLVKAAQDIAAAEAAAARALLESALDDGVDASLQAAGFPAIETSLTKLGRPAS